MNCRNHVGLESRLESDLDHPHLSARMDLFPHDHFVSKNWVISLEPEFRIDAYFRFCNTETPHQALGYWPQPRCSCQTQ